MWQNLENHMNTFTINGTILTKGHQHSIFKIFNSIWLWRFWPSPSPTANQNILKNSCLFFLSGLSFMDTDNWQDRRGREGTIFYSIPLYHSHPLTNIQTFICNFAQLPSTAIHYTRNPFFSSTMTSIIFI